ncbi:ComEC/Rec2 family competence protein [Microbacterium excoecariae]|uniref:ComEC/Rec2 family competence protein n=1 Tax=Microbacterium excoecariae TaxID=2715210 RepID=UPI00140E18DC|nr:ComEC/Rec2 family competence protein [Microbacterium excoecariae]NHI17020.1 MBL fold metallo-hydrolase [Microbacterium excoecariae]
MTTDPPGAERPRRDLRMLAVAGVAWAAALVCVVAPGGAAWIAGACAVAAVGAVVIARARSSPVWAVAVVACAVGACVAGHVAVAEPGRRAQAADLEGSVNGLVVTVTSKVEPSAGGVRFTADGPAPVSVMWPGGAAQGGLDLGARVALTGEAWRADPGEAAVAVVRASAVEVRAPPGGILAAASALRHGFVADVVRGLPEPGAGLLPGLSVGDTSGVSAELDADMIASSLSHLTAVSGANCALVVGIAYAACALCGARRGVRVAAGAVALAGFVVLVTPEASVIRAAAMAGVAMIALLTGRQGAGVAVLGVAVTILLLSDPWLAASFGFALSAAATAALLLLAGPLADGLARVMPRPLALAIAVPLAAQLACGPIIVLFAPEVALYGVVANMIAGPAAPAATVLGLAACLAQPIPVLADGLAALAWIPSAWVAQTAHTFAALPAARLTWQAGFWGALALAVLGAAAAAALVRTGRTRWARASRGAGRLLLVAILGTGAGAIAVQTVVEPLTTPRDWSIALCDVGQGDAILLRDAGAVALVDTGPDPRALSACLDRLGVDRVDIAFITHFDSDHVGGAVALAGRVDRILHGPAESPAEAARLSGLGARSVGEGSAGLAGRIGGAEWRILWPRDGTRAFAPGNDTSLVLDIGGGSVPRTLLLGDLSEQAQRLLAAAGEGGDVEVVKVSHHGSRDQLPALYAAARAELALVGVGENDYGHPHPDTLALLRASGAAIARTDTDGLVLAGGPGALWVWRDGR